VFWLTAAASEQHKCVSEFEDSSCFSIFLPDRPARHVTEPYKKGLAGQMLQDMSRVTTNRQHCHDTVTFWQHFGNISRIAKMCCDFSDNTSRCFREVQCNILGNISRYFPKMAL
jgi:hypothetical protein